MAIIGINDAAIASASNPITTSFNPSMADRTSAVTGALPIIRTAVSAEAVTLIGVYCFIANSTSTVRIALYDITDGTDGATLEFYDSITANFNVGNTWHTKEVLWNLTAGRTYAVSIAVTSGASFRTTSTQYSADTGSRDTTTTGAAIAAAPGTPDPWTDIVYTRAWAGYASTEILATIPTLTFADANGNTDLRDLSDTAFTGQAKISVFLGATLAALGTTPEFEGTINFTGGEVVIDVSTSSLTTGQDVLVRIGQDDTDKRATIFMQVD